jgi:hypothetical protein
MERRNNNNINIEGGKRLGLTAVFRKAPHESVNRRLKEHDIAYGFN